MFEDCPLNIYPIPPSEYYRLSPTLKEKININNGILVVGELLGEFRCPLKGEWFISGSIPECYYSPCDLTQKYRIVIPILVEKIITYKRIE